MHPPTHQVTHQVTCTTLALPLAPLPQFLIAKQSEIIHSKLWEDSGPSIDVVALLLADKRSADTRRAYAADLRDFFGCDPTPALVASFIDLSTPEIALRVTTYKNAMLARGLSEATVNRRLAAIRALLKFAHRLGHCATDGRNIVDGEKVRAYRDTRGVDVKTLKKLLKAPARLHGENSVRAHRDVALLTILIENALRRAEVCKLDVSDFEYGSSSITILGKGRGSQKERITLSPHVAEALRTYLIACGRWGTPGALFVNLDRRPEYSGTRLTVDGLYQLIGEYGKAIGLQRLTPHQLRHSAITAALDATKGDVRRVQKLSRHSRIETLMLYDDNRSDSQGQVSNILSKLLK